MAERLRPSPSNPIFIRELCTSCTDGIDRQPLIKRWVSVYRSLDEVLGHVVALIRGHAQTSYFGTLARKLSHQADAQAVYTFVRDRIAYVRDRAYTEHVQGPYVTLAKGRGDCEDHVVLAAILLIAQGFTVRLFVIQQRGSSGFNHILLQYRQGGAWRNFDTTVASFAGDSEPSGIVARRYVEVVPGSALLAGRDDLPSILSHGDIADVHVTDKLPLPGGKTRLALAVDGKRNINLLRHGWSEYGQCFTVRVVSKTESGAIVDNVVISNGGIRCSGSGFLTVPNAPYVLELYRGTASIDDVRASKGVLAASPLIYRSDKIETAPSDELFPEADKATQLIKWSAIALGVGSLMYLVGPIVATKRAVTAK